MYTYTVGELKIDLSFRRCNSFPTGATDLVLVALHSLSPQLQYTKFHHPRSKFTGSTPFIRYHMLSYRASSVCYASGYQDLHQPPHQWGQKGQPLS
jgi:hypothetical protein